MNFSKTIMILSVLGFKEVDNALSFFEPMTENFINSLLPVINTHYVRFDKFMTDTVIEGISESLNGISEKPCQNKRRRITIKCDLIK